MYQLIVNDWSLALHEFSDLLLKSIKDNLVMILGLDEESSVYDSNVLVVVKELNEEVKRTVAKAAIEVNDKHKSTISYYLTTVNDKQTISLFSKVKSGKDDCNNAFEDFYARIKDYITDIIFLGNKYYCDTNVLIVVKEVNDEVRRKIAKAAIEVNDKHECVISYYLTNDRNRELIDEFKKVRDSV